jgi:ribonucleoside-diphosphate reductase beta chain
MKGSCDFAVHLHNHHLVNKVPKDRIRIIVDALNMKRVYHGLFQFFGMNAGLMTIEFVADRLLVELGCDRDTTRRILLILWI